MVNPIETKGSSLKTCRVCELHGTAALHGVARGAVLSWLRTWTVWRSSTMTMGTVHPRKKKKKDPLEMPWGEGREDQCAASQRCVTRRVCELHMPGPCEGSLRRCFELVADVDGVMIFNNGQHSSHAILFFFINKDIILYKKLSTRGTDTKRPVRWFPRAD